MTADYSAAGLSAESPAADTHERLQVSAPAPRGNVSEIRTEVVQLVIDADPASPDLTVVHVAGRGDQLRQLVRAVVDGARQLGQRVLEIRPVAP